MKRTVLALIGMLAAGISSAPAQIIPIDSWENSNEGWTVVNTSDYALGGFSTTAGVTAGKYSLIVNNLAGNYIWDTSGKSPDLQSASSAALTQILMRTSTLSVDVYVPAGNFGWGLVFNFFVNQPNGAGIMSISNTWGLAANLGGQTTLTMTVPASIRQALMANPTLPSSLLFTTGGGGAGTMYLDNLRANLQPPAQASLWVRELWDDLPPGDQIPANTVVTNDTSSVGFTASAPWMVNPAEVTNCEIMAFRQGFQNDPLVGSDAMGLPCSLDGSYGAMVQQNNGFSFFPVPGQGSFWTAGDFMTRQLDPSCYIDFQAAGEYWFTMTIANMPWNGSAGSLDSQYVTFPASGWVGLGFADGTTTNDDFVAIGVTGLNVYIGPTNATGLPWQGQTDVSKALYISQGTLGQAGNLNSTAYNPILDPSANPADPGPTFPYSQTNFTAGPYHINAFATNTVGALAADYIVLLGHLRTSANGTATLDAKYYCGTQIAGERTSNMTVYTTTNITYDVSYSFNFTGAMSRMLLFENGQFPCYVFGFRASTNFAEVVGLDPGRIAVSPLAATYTGYAINMTNLAVEANTWSWPVGSAPPLYGTLNYQWYKNGALINGATSQNYNIATAAPSDAGTYSCVATDPSGTWGSVSTSVAITVTTLPNPQLTSAQPLQDQNTFVVAFNEANLNGVGNSNNYSFNNGIVISNVTVVNEGTWTQVELQTSPLPLGTKVTLTITGVTNVVGGLLGTTNVTFWTDLIESGTANWEAWAYPGALLAQDYFGNFVPANPNPYVLQTMALSSWDGPTTGVTIMGSDGYVGDDWGSKLFGWFVPPVTTNYVFFIACDDGGRLSLSTDATPENLRYIACDSYWNGADEWTNICDEYPGPGSPHRGDGTATAPASTTGYVWDNSVSGQSPATACVQNRSDQFIVAYYDSSGASGGPVGATDQANWGNALSQVTECILTNNFWPQQDANGQAQIHLQAGQMYYMQLEHFQQGGGYNGDVTYKIAGTPDPLSPTNSVLTGSVIAGTVPFTPTISIARTEGGPVITYTGVLLAGTNVDHVTNVVAQSSASTAISLGGPSRYTPAAGAKSMFYRTSE